MQIFYKSINLENTRKGYLVVLYEDLFGKKKLIIILVFSVNKRESPRNRIGITFYYSLKGE